MRTGSRVGNSTGWREDHCYGCVRERAEKVPLQPLRRRPITEGAPSGTTFFLLAQQLLSRAKRPGGNAALSLRSGMLWARPGTARECLVGGETAPAMQRHQAQA